MTFESHTRKDIPNLNDSDDEWKKYWDSCSIGGIVSTLEKLVQTDRKERPINNKSLYLRALECKEALNKPIRKVISLHENIILSILLSEE